MVVRRGSSQRHCCLKVVVACMVVGWLLVLWSQTARLARGDGGPLPTRPATPDDALHIIFSTDCGAYQNWQSEVLYHSAMTVDQPGVVTRIASGCEATEEAALRARHELPDLKGRFLLHVTPHFSTDASGKDYKFYNKPFGLKHWLEHARPAVRAEAIVALIDPDFIFMRPLTTSFADPELILATKPVSVELAGRWSANGRVERGKPVGQFYGLGDLWTKFDRAHICGPRSSCLNTTSAEAWQFYSVGPPYIAHRADMAAIAEKWVEFVPRVYEEYPALLAEMYAYCMAAAHLGLPHLRLDHFMVSNAAAYGEAWRWVDELDLAQVCADRGDESPANKPVFVHYCQNYRLGDLAFGKRRVPLDLFSDCNAAPLERPSRLQLAAALPALSRDASSDETKERRDAQRKAFVLCATVDTVNDVGRKFTRAGLRHRPDGKAC